MAFGFLTEAVLFLDTVAGDLFTLEFALCALATLVFDRILELLLLLEAVDLVFTLSLRIGTLVLGALLVTALRLVDRDLTDAELLATRLFLVLVMSAFLRSTRLLMLRSARVLGV